MSDGAKLAFDVTALVITGTGVVASIVIAIIAAAYTLVRHSNSQHAANVGRFAEIDGVIRSTTAETNGKIDVIATKVEPIHEWFMKGKKRTK